MTCSKKMLIFVTLSQPDGLERRGREGGRREREVMEGGRKEGSEGTGGRKEKVMEEGENEREREK